MQTFNFNLENLKVIKINKNIYQIEAGKRAVVIKAKSQEEAIKEACRLLGVKYDKSTLKVVK